MRSFFLTLFMLSLFIPWSMIVGPVLLAPVDFLLVAFFILWLVPALVRREKIFIPGFFIYIGAFLLGVVCSLFTSIDIARSIKEIIQYVQLSGLTILYFNNTLRSKAEVSVMIQAIVLGAGVLGVIIANAYLHGGMDAVYAIGFHKNAVGSFMAMGTPLALWNYRANRTWPAFILFVAVLAGLVFSFSRGAWVGVVVALLLTEILFNRKQLWLLFFVVLLGLVSYIVVPQTMVKKVSSSHTLDIRREQWAIAKRGIHDYPLLGIGYANFETLSDLYGKTWTFEDPHNIVLRIFAETGIVGLLGFIILFYGIYFYGFYGVVHESDEQQRKYHIALFAALIAYLVHGMFDVFWVRGTGTLFWILVALVVYIGEQQQLPPVKQ